MKNRINPYHCPICKVPTWWNSVCPNCIKVIYGYPAKKVIKVSYGGEVIIKMSYTDRKE